MIYFTKYATQKFELLKKHGVEVNKDMVKETVNTPTETEKKETCSVAKKNNLKVIYKQDGDAEKIITFYPV